MSRQHLPLADGRFRFRFELSDASGGHLYHWLDDAARFVVEFWRINPRGFLGLTEFQLFAIPLMLIGVIGWVWSGEKRGEGAAKEAARA